MKIKKLSMEVSLLDGPSVPIERRLCNEARIIVEFEDGSGKSASLLSDRNGDFDGSDLAAALRIFARTLDAA